MRVRLPVRSALLIALSASLGAVLGLVVATRPVAAEESCPNNRCDFMSGYCYHQAGSNRYCWHVGGEQGCYNTFC